jgi:hypothetical protein
VHSRFGEVEPWANPQGESLDPFQRPGGCEGEGEDVSSASEGMHCWPALIYMAPVYPGRT